MVVAEEQGPQETATEPVKDTVAHVEQSSPETHTPEGHVSREEFDGLKGVLDGLIAKVDHLAPVTERDQVPGKKPWTHMGSR